MERLFSRAVECFEDLTKKGYILAEYYYAIMLFDGDGIKQDKQGAIEYFRDLIQEEFPEAMFKYANILYQGDGIELNKRKAAKYYKMAADKGDIIGLKSCLVMLENNKGEKEEETIKEIITGLDECGRSLLSNFLHNAENKKSEEFKEDIKTLITKYHLNFSSLTGRITNKILENLKSVIEDNNIDPTHPNKALNIFISKEEEKRLTEYMNSILSSSEEVSESLESNSKERNTNSPSISG